MSAKRRESKGDVAVSIKVSVGVEHWEEFLEVWEQVVQDFISFGKIEEAVAEMPLRESERIELSRM